MPRSLRPVAAALALVFVLGACAGSSEATQGSVRDQVKNGLLERPDNELSDEEAGVVADCVARAFFESGDFTKEERDDAVDTLDGEEPDPDLVAKVERVVNRCLDDA